RNVGGQINLFERGFRNLDENLAGAGVDDGLGLSFTSDELSANEETCFQSLRGLGHNVRLRPEWVGCQGAEKGAGDGD
ncbi:MAG: hypothetical protein EBU36_05055, partial [Verrucomicrobia bacterium]|nr:hypothetical protein [Verrucomicrobiota bacterium]